MAIELRHSARTAERSEPTDPSQTGPRARPSDFGSRAEERRASTSSLERPSEQASADRHSAVPARRSRVTRPSMRPSAFGMPRTSAPPGPDSGPPSSKPAMHRSRTDDPRASTKRESAPPDPGSSGFRSLGDEPRGSSLRSRSEEPRTAAGESARNAPGSKKRDFVGAPPPAVKTDIEALLPISQGVKSLPRPPRLPSFEPNQHALPAPRRFPWASLSVFAVMLAASLAPLFHYRGEGKQALPGEPSARGQAGALSLTAKLKSADDTVLGAVVEPLPVVSALGSQAEGPRASAPSAVERIERAFWGQPARVHQALLEEGERALRANDERLAETLFARARDFDGDDPQGAVGLARVRLAQGDLEGAEGWVLLAIRQRPRRAEYRALHAEILQRFGRGPEAQLERALARSLPSTTPHFPAETRSR